MFVFGSTSLVSRSQLHPKLQLVVDQAIKEVDFRILDATRGRNAQERAFAEHRSKAHFGDSAHNYVPAIAMDLFPAPYDWKNTASFEALAKIVLRVGHDLSVPLRWGGDWNMDGTKTTSDNWDKPHFELHPWRTWAKQSKLFEG
jgi:peptidoglycan L-alanyl-D-glutamate endopeptidase CwlK